jgi:hypothetical protein
LIRYIRSGPVLDFFGEKFKVQKDFGHVYVKAVLVIQIHQLQIYLGDDWLKQKITN